LGKGRLCRGDPVEPMPKPGTERAVVDCAADLEQPIGAVAPDGRFVLRDPDVW
jgi:hypothetical protein